MMPLNYSKLLSNMLGRTSVYLRICLSLCLLLAVNLLTYAQTNKTASRKQPNVLIFLVDDMVLMDTSVPFLTDENGKPKSYPLNEYYKTPGMEKLAEKGIRFETFYANSVCSPSRASLMTGQSSARHHITQWIDPVKKNDGPKEWNWKGLSSKDITLPSLLQKNGYFTIHVGKAHFGPVGSEGENPLNLGFDVNVAGSSIGRPADYFGQNNFGKGLRHVKDLEAFHGTNTHLSDALTKEMCKSIDKAVEQEK
jgi:arylsulfatase A-like enzyme